MRKSYRGRLRRGNDGGGISKKEFWSAPRCLSKRRGERSCASRAKRAGGMRGSCGRGRPRSGARTSPSAAGKGGGSVGKFRQASSVIAATGADARGPGCGRPRPQRAGVGGNAGKFRQASSVIAAAGGDARGPGRGGSRPQRAGAGRQRRQVPADLLRYRCCGWCFGHSRAPVENQAGRVPAPLTGELLCGTRSRATETVALPILKGKASSTAGFDALADQLRTLTLAGIDAVGNGRGFSTSGAPIDGKPTKVERRQVTDSSPPRP